MVLKKDKFTILGITSIADLLVSVPTISTAIAPSVAKIASVVLAQISFGVMLTSKVIPILT